MIQNPLFDIEILDARSILLESKIPLHKEYEDKFHLSKIEFNSSISLSVGERIDIQFINTEPNYKTFYKINYMYKETNTLVRINEFESNASSTYVLPLIEIKADHLLLDTNFINCYSGHYDFKHDLGEYVYLIYRYIPIDYYSKFSEIILKQGNCIHHQKEKDQRFDCFVFKVREEFRNDIKLILKGKFSKISDSAKQKIITFHKQTRSDAPINQILYKGELRRNELEESLGCILPDNIDYAEKPKKEEEIWTV